MTQDGARLPAGDSLESLHCVEIVEIATAYLEDALESPRRLAFEEHLAYCRECRDYLAQLRLGIELARDAGQRTETVSEEARAELLRLFREHRGEP